MALDTSFANGRRWLVAGLLSVAAFEVGCTHQDQTRPGLASVRDEIETRVWTFHAADTAMNAEAVIGLLWPDYEMLVDGQRIGFDEVAQGSREFMASLESFATTWTGLQITPLSRDIAISSFQFRDSIVTSSGEVLQSRGPTTLVWERRNGEWRVRFGDADHYPVTPQPDTD